MQETQKKQRKCVKDAPVSTLHQLRIANWLTFEPIESKQQKLRIETLLCTSPHVDVKSILQRLAQAHIEFSDLPCLVLEDYQHLGLLEESDNMRRTLKCLSHQYASFDEICSMPEAQKYNERILAEAHKNLHNLHLKLLQAYVKMLKHPPADLVVGEKNFASKFLVETLSELNNAADRLNKELQYFRLAQTSCKKAKATKSWLTLGLECSTILLGISLAGYIVWKLQRASPIKFST